MARPRKPTALVVASGRDQVNPGRYKERIQNEPDVSTGIGDPPDYIKNTDECLARDAWRQFCIEIPWLNQSHTALLEAASLIRGDIMAGNSPGVPRLTLMRALLQSLGATPSDSSKIGVSPGKEGEGKVAAKSIFKDDDDDDD